MGGDEVTRFTCIALTCLVTAAKCAERWRDANRPEKGLLSSTPCATCPLGQAFAAALLSIAPPRPKPAAPSKRARSKGVGRGKSIPWDNLPGGLVLGSMSDSELARRLAPYVQGGVTDAAVRSARYTRKIRRYIPPRHLEPPRPRDLADDSYAKSA